MYENATLGIGTCREAPGRHTNAPRHSPDYKVSLHDENQSSSIIITQSKRLVEIKLKLSCLAAVATVWL